MRSMLKLGEGVGGTCVGLHRFDTDGEGEVGLSTAVPLPVQRAVGGGKKKREGL